MNIFIAPFINALFALYNLTGNLGWAVVLVTVLVRILLLPLLWPSLRSSKKMREIQPKLTKLKEKYGKDKEGLAKAQMDLYKTEGVNPLSGCLPQLLQVAVLIAFFSAFNMVVAYSEGKGGLDKININLVEPLKVTNEFKFESIFLGTSLAETPAKVAGKGLGIWLLLPAILLLGSGVLQYLSAKLMMPESSNKKVDATVYTKATESKEDDMMAAMRTQSLYMMPAMTVFIGWNFSVGMLLYWFVNSLVMYGQQILAEKVMKNS